MVNNNERKYMQRAIDLSLKGRGRVNPNPLVGAVLVKNKRVIGEGYHEFFGGPHAEVNAIRSAKETIEGATLYVTLEPCNHQGKTPPCTELIIRNKIDRVVVAMKDPNPIVSGKGMDQLRNAGITVLSGLLEEEAKKVNEVFTKYIKEKTPFVALKTAMTFDGKIATRTGDSRWITNNRSRAWVHELRHRYSAIMVGIDTVISDDPELTDRSPHSIKSHPLRVVVDSSCKIPLDARILDIHKAPTIVAVTRKAPAQAIRQLRDKGVEVVICPEKKGMVDLIFLCKALGGKGIDSLLIEGGGKLNFSGLTEGLADRIYSFIAPKIIGGQNAPGPMGGDGFENISEAVTLHIDSIQRFDEDILIEATINKK